MGPIVEAARKYGLTIVEDATESLGATYRGQMVGHLGDVGCFSFNGNKLITTGGGGMIVTDNAQWADRARYLTTQAKDDPIEYYHNEIGFNYRLTKIQAALGLAQIELIEEFIQKKKTIANRYRQAFAGEQGITLMGRGELADPVDWLSTILLSEDVTIEDRKSVIQRLNKKGIGVRPLWHPLHNLPPYAESQAYRIEHATDLYTRAISLPSSVGLEPGDQDRCIAAVIQEVQK